MYLSYIWFFCHILYTMLTLIKEIWDDYINTHKVCFRAKNLVVIIKFTSELWRNQLNMAIIIWSACSPNWPLKDLKWKLIEMQGKDKSKIKVRDFSKSLSIIDRINGHKISKVISLKQYYQSLWFKWHFQDTPYNSSRIHIIFKCTLNVCQDKSYFRP